MAWINGQTTISATAELDLSDRAGGSDSFAASLFYGLVTAEEPQLTVNPGWAHGALVIPSPDDTTKATVNQMRTSAKSGSACIQR